MMGVGGVMGVGEVCMHAVLAGGWVDVFRWFWNFFVSVSCLLDSVSRVRFGGTVK